MSLHSYIAALRRALPDLERPPQTARGLPAFVYGDAEWFAAERSGIFAPAWMALGFESDAAAPGDVVPVDIAGWSLVMVRGRDGRLRVFRNLCPHRGMRLVAEPRERCASLACRWHAWTFDLDGRLKATPNLGGPGQGSQADFDRAQIGLTPVRADTWMGVVFVNLDGRAPPLQQHLQPFLRRLGAYDWAASAQAADIACDYDYRCNWKLAIEGGIEDYHIPFVHSQMGPGGRFAGTWGEDCFVGSACRRTVAEGSRRVLNAAGAGVKPLPRFPHVPEAGETEASVIINLFPNLLIAAVLDHVTVTVIVPPAVDRTRYRRRFRLVEPAATSPGYAATRRSLVESWTRVTAQDGPLWDEVQALMAERGEIGFRNRFSAHWESAVLQFQRMAAARMLRAFAEGRPAEAAAG